MNNDKMITTAKNLDILAKICGSIASAAAIVCAVFAVLVLIFRQSMFKLSSFSLDLDFVKLHLAGEFPVDEKMIIFYAILSLIAAGIFCFLLSYICRLIRGILAPMKEGRPFETGISSNLKRIAWTVVAGGFITEILGIVERMLLLKAYPVTEILTSSAISKVEYVFTMDLSFLLIACVILFLSYIFDYGMILQQESDETL